MQELQAWFPDDAACLAYLERLRWGAGFSCPLCSGASFWQAGDGLRVCRACQRRTSVTAGTIFHRTRSPLQLWFMAAWLITAQKNGMSAQSLQRVLGLRSYETAWAWLHKFRRAMVREGRDRLRGQVEVGETLVDGVSAGYAGGSTGRACVMVAVEKPGPGRVLGRIRLGLADRPGTPGLMNFARNAVEPGSIVRTDGALPGVRLVASLLQRWLTGTLHYGVAGHHLPYYLDEFTFRFNRRSADHRGLLFYRLLEQAVVTDPHPLEEILDPDHNPYWNFS
ncbi:MAG: IS1595 family transposase [Leucobacter sp.]|nr:IS1595 family transposase [Leucobacter sp.]